MVYSFDVKTVVTNTCTVKARSEREARAIAKQALLDSFEDMMETATFDDEISEAFEPSENAIDRLADNKIAWGIE